MAAGSPGEQDDRERLVMLVHDLRTPLALVLGFAELLSERADDLTPAQRHEYMQRLSAAAVEMRELLDSERSERVTAQ